MCNIIIISPVTQATCERSVVSDSSGSDQDLGLISNAVVTFSFDEDMQPDLSIKTRNTQQWTPIAALTRAKLRNN